MLFQRKLGSTVALQQQENNRSESTVFALLLYVGLFAESKTAQTVVT